VPAPIALADLPGETASQFIGADHGASVSFFVTRTPPGRGPALHVHPYDETFILERGDATFTVGDDEVRIEYAGLARGEDPAIAVAVADLARRHGAALGEQPASAPVSPANVD